MRAYAKKYIVGKPHVIGVLISPDARRAIGLTDADVLGDSVTTS